MLKYSAIHTGSVHTLRIYCQKSIDAISEGLLQHMVCVHGQA